MIKNKHNTIINFYCGYNYIIETIFVEYNYEVDKKSFWEFFNFFNTT